MAHGVVDIVKQDGKRLAAQFFYLVFQRRKSNRKWSTIQASVTLKGIVELNGTNFKVVKVGQILIEP